MTDDATLIEITARLTAHEFILEVFTANITADWSDHNVAEFWKSLVNREPYISKGPVDVDVMERQVARYQSMIESFSQKSMKRREEVIQGRARQR